MSFNIVPAVLRPLAFAVGCLVAAQTSLAANASSAPSRIGGILPDYPPIARRYNVQGSVVIRLTVDVDGHVKRTDIVRSSADVLSDSVLRATTSWVFTKPAASTTVLMRLPFTLDGGQYAFDTAVLPIESAPKNQDELGKQLIPGWCEAKVLINSQGVVGDRLVLRVSSPEFRALSEAIIDSLRFARSAEGVPGATASTMNGVLIQVSADSQIQIRQRPGNAVSPEIDEPPPAMDKKADAR